MEVCKYVVVLLLFIACVASALLPAYDFIIVGSGGVGSVLAGRLSGETNQQILLIEAGALGTGQQALGGTDYVASKFVTDPATGKLKLGQPWTRYDVPAYEDTIRDAGAVLNNQWNISAIGPLQAQSKVIGGNHATNGMDWKLPLKENFDNWNIPGFSGNTMWNYFKAIENVTATGLTNHTARGFSGPIWIVVPPILDTPATEFLTAAEATGYTTQLDANNGEINPPNYYYYGQRNYKNGIRSNAPLGWLAPALATNRNLHFLTSATVTRVLFNSHKVATGVEYVDANGNYHVVNAKKEVVLAGGILEIPQLLYNSGIGPLSILNAFGKPHVVVNELIGQKIRSMHSFSMTYYEPSRINPSILTLPLQSISYATDGSGWLQSTGGPAVQLRVNPDHPHNDIEIGTGALVGSSTANVYSQNISFTINLMYNQGANGTLNLTDSNPLGGTLFTINQFALAADVDTVVKGIYKAREIAANWPTTFIETYPGPDVDTYDELAAAVRAKGSVNCHFHGSVPMGTTAEWPLNERLLVRGVTHLRVVGPAAAPNYVARGMQALASVFGMKGTDLIKEDWHL